MLQGGLSFLKLPDLVDTHSTMIITPPMLIFHLVSLLYAFPGPLRTCCTPRCGPPCWAVWQLGGCALISAWRGGRGGRGGTRPQVVSAGAAQTWVCGRAAPEVRGKSVVGAWGVGARGAAPTPAAAPPSHFPDSLTAASLFYSPSFSGRLKEASITMPAAPSTRSYYFYTGCCSHSSSL